MNTGSAHPSVRPSGSARARASASPHRRFAVIVRRRLWIARAVEVSGAALAWLAVAASVATLMGRPILIPPLAAVAVVVAAVQIFRSRPTVALVARLSDRHGGWDDLLATALATGDDADPFAAAVRATADVRCRTVRPSTVPVARRGRRGWMAIATAVGLSLLVVLWPSRGTTGGTGDADPATAALLVADADPSTAVSQPPATPAPVIRRTGADDLASRGSTPPADNVSPTTPDGSAHPRVDPRSASAGTGRGSASSARDPAAEPDPQASTAAHADTGTADTNTADTGTTVAGTTVAGGGRSARPATPGTGALGGTTATANPGPSIPPWQSPGWPAARRDAERAVRDGTVPPQDRGLVRDYFDRAPANNADRD